MKGKYLFVTAILSLSVLASACGSSKNDVVKEQVPLAASVPEGKLKSTSADAKEVIQLSSTSENEVQESIVGYYKVTKMISDGQDISSEVEQLAAMGSGIFMIIHEDNTGEVNMMGEISKIEIDDKYVIIKDEDSGESENVEYQFKDGEIVLAQDTNEMVFTRMSDDEIEAFKNGDYVKSIDEITDDILNNAYDEATGELNEDYKDIIGAIDDATTVEPYEEEEQTVEFDESYLPDFSSDMHEDTGFFEIVEFQECDNKYTADQLRQAGVDFDMMLCPDGTGYAHFLGTYYDLSWKDGLIYVVTDDGQEKMEYYAAENEGKKTITIADSDIAMVFEFVKDADETYKWAGGSGLKP